MKDLYTQVIKFDLEYNNNNATIIDLMKHLKTAKKTSI